MAAIRQECNDANGCFMANNHPKMEDFEGPFGTNPPRDIQFTDVDCTVEVDDCFLFVEFKNRDGMERGQERYYERLSSLKGVFDKYTCTVFHVVGNGAQRHATSYRECIGGKWTDYVPCDWESLKPKIQGFRETAKERYRAFLLAKNRRLKIQPTPNQITTSDIARLPVWPIVQNRANLAARLPDYTSNRATSVQRPIGVK